MLQLSSKDVPPSALSNVETARDKDSAVDYSSHNHSHGNASPTLVDQIKHLTNSNTQLDIADSVEGLANAHTEAVVDVVTAEQTIEPTDSHIEELEARTPTTAGVDTFEQTPLKANSNNPFNRSPSSASSNKHSTSSLPGYIFNFDIPPFAGAKTSPDGAQASTITPSMSHTMSPRNSDSSMTSASSSRKLSMLYPDFLGIPAYERKLRRSTEFNAHRNRFLTSF